MRKGNKCMAAILASVLMLGACGSGGGGGQTVKEGAEPGITVLPVENLSEDFTMGVDISSLIAEEESGVKYYDVNGEESDLITLLKNAGANCVRIRVWNDPHDADGNSYGAGTCDVETAVKIGKRATKAGLGVLIDFHYSDFWADPNKQRSPKAWEGMSIDEKTEALSAFTTDSLNTLKKGGVKVTMVQVGNEINNGMSGENSDDNVCALLKAGSEAVRAFDPDIQIVMHYTDPMSSGYLAGKAEMLRQHGVDYDILGTSYYPFWHGDVNDLTGVLKDVADTYGVKVMVMETSYLFTDEDGDGYGNVVNSGNSGQTFKYPVSVEGQATAVRDVIEAVSDVGDAGAGVFYWEPAWIPVKAYDGDADILSGNREIWEKYGSGWASSFASEFDPEVKDKYNGATWDNQAFFDFEGNALESINVFKYVYTGCKGPLSVRGVDAPALEFAYGEANSLPETVTVHFNDGTDGEAPVVWNESDAAAVLDDPDFGDYEVRGTVSGLEKDGEAVEGEYEIVCSVKVGAHSYLENGTFETGDLSGWTVENASGTGEPKVDSNKENAKEGEYYFTAWDMEGFDCTLSQTIESGMEAGTYRCFASFQGTGAKNPSDSQLKVIVTAKDGTSQEYTSDITIPNEWKNFYLADISGIVVDENTASVTVLAQLSFGFDSDTGANGVWVVMDDVNLLKE
ncbi:MAG: glycosyl hydrolase 53 family protein [Blautia sp.]|nr:glycosyl hydrolase 53 family protein [Blautia sp.]